MVASSDDSVIGAAPAVPASPGPSHGEAEGATVAQACSGPLDMPFWSAARLAQAIKGKKIGALELLNIYLARAEKYNGQLNAIVDLDVAGARKRARAADDALTRGETLGPLHGVPITVKDSIDVAGLASTWGIREFKDNRPARSAPVVDALTAAGAIAFGKTNVPLALLSWETFNDLHGTTNNPWDVSRSPGGSSGGSAAALAAGLTALEVGSDTAGSLRGPAHACGVYTHRPTFGVTSVEGQSLPGFGPLPDIMVLGPMARSAEDLTIALDIMAGPDEADAAAWRLALPPPRHSRLSDFRVAVLLDHRGQEVDRELRELLSELADFLSRKGAKVSMKARPEIDYNAAHKLFLNLSCASVAGCIPEQYWDKLSAMAQFLRRKKDNSSELAAVLNGYTDTHREWIRLDLVRNHLRAAWASFFRDYDVLLCPVAATAAQPHDQSSKIDRFRKIIVNGKPVAASEQWFWAGLPAVAYLPATVAPAGFTASGLPVGVQIIGPQYGDHTCLAFARLLEQEYQAFVPPKGWA
jgi:amidase